MSSNPLLHTDPNSYKLIETFSEVDDVKDIDLGNHTLTGARTGWQPSTATVNGYLLVATAGECTAGTAQDSVECTYIDMATGVQNWYVELGTLASNENVRVHIKTQYDALDRDDASFNGIAIYFKNNGGISFDTRIVAVIGGSLDTTNDEAFAVHSTTIAAAVTRIGALITYDGTDVTLTISGVTRTLTLDNTARAIFNADGKDSVALLYAKDSGAGGGTGKMFEIRAW